MNQTASEIQNFLMSLVADLKLANQLIQTYLFSVSTVELLTKLVKCQELLAELAMIPEISLCHRDSGCC